MIRRENFGKFFIILKLLDGEGKGSIRIQAWHKPFTNLLEISVMRRCTHPNVNIVPKNISIALKKIN